MPNKKPGLLDPDLEKYLRGHPSTAESLIPVWGSAREAVADVYDGDYLGAAGNTVLAVSDFIPAKAIGGVALKAGLKGATKVEASLKAGRRLETALKDGARAAQRAVVPSNPKNWKQTSQWYLDQGYREKKIPAHHAFIERGSTLGKKFPQLVNQAWNLKPLKPDIHKRIHSADRIKELPRFNVGQRVWHGTPAWSKGVAVGAPTRAGVLTYEAQDRPTKGR